jgi:hypothetical protein
MGVRQAAELSPPNTIDQTTVALKRLMEEDAEAGRPFIAALVVSKARGGLPAVGFFDCARRLDRFTDDSQWSGGPIFPRNRAECGPEFLGWVQLSGTLATQQLCQIDACAP